MLRAMHQELQREYGLTGARSARQQRGASARQTSAGNLIQTGDAGRRFRSVLTEYPATQNPTVISCPLLELHAEHQPNPHDAPQR
jgi:hypothetical protein